MKSFLVLVVLLLLPACVDLTFTVQVPCSATLVRDTTAAAADTVLRWRADTLACPRPAP